ncbi:aryl-sulfate sulfotransferase [Levilactobacillus parabrevis]|uniref:Arylsulfate sulfotransferase n=1 Tax=Levilactobacillus parabrevis ATCC 53295 TaxID=1267003 RepID=A0A0R1GLY1_9LACO|nr:aryl-sulfate sulfotransferase [Levilactobacillus parabrevis]KRK35006.1 arylsulfate sulfotransferase [Levilactobacillus parabrevis ATCC 53295]KRO06833.1 arylsulfate sulfotransferase [Levilactobacillus parabrevis]
MKKLWKITIGVLLALIVVGGAAAYHERHNIRRYLLVHQRYAKKDILTTNQIKLNIRPALSTANTTSTNKLSKTYRQDLKQVKAGSTNAKVIVNPYKTSPLAGLILVKTEAATKVTLTVHGDTPTTTITKHLKGYKTQHAVGVLGLYADRTNRVTLTFTRKNGTTTRTTYTMKTTAAPKAIGKNTLKTSKPKQMALGHGNTKLTFAVSSLGYTYGLDAKGQVRWYSTKPISHVFKQLANKHLLLNTKVKTSDSKSNALQETDFYGRVYHQYNMNGLFPSKDDPSKLANNTVIHHDAIELPNHNFLLTVDDGSKKFVEDTMIEVDRNTGKIKKVIDLKRILPKSAYENYNGTHRADGKIDWFHQNSMYYNRKNGELIISGRNQDMMLAINYKTTKLKWILAAPEKLPQSYHKYLLKPTTKHYRYNGGQHAVMLINTAKNTGSKIDLEFYDNNVPVTRGKTKQSKQWSAGEIVSIDQLKKTVTKTWSFGRTLGKRNFTNIVGSSYDVGKGNTLIGFGYADHGKRSEFVEVNRKTKQIVFDVDRTGFRHGDWSYRAQRMTLYPGSANLSLQDIQTK